MIFEFCLTRCMLALMYVQHCALRGFIPNNSHDTVYNLPTLYSLNVCAVPHTKKVGRNSKAYEVTLLYTL